MVFLHPSRWLNLPSSQGLGMSILARGLSTTLNLMLCEKVLPLVTLSEKFKAMRIFVGQPACGISLWYYQLDLHHERCCPCSQLYGTSLCTVSPHDGKFTTRIHDTKSLSIRMHSSMNSSIVLVVLSLWTCPGLNQSVQLSSGTVVFVVGKL